MKILTGLSNSAMFPTRGSDGGNRKMRKMLVGFAGIWGVFSLFLTGGCSTSSEDTTTAVVMFAHPNSVLLKLIRDKEYSTHGSYFLCENGQLVFVQTCRSGITPYIKQTIIFQPDQVSCEAIKPNNARPGLNTN